MEIFKTKKVVKIYNNREEVYIKEYNAEGLLIHSKKPNNIEKWWTFYDNGFLKSVVKKSKKGRNKISEYDERGNRIYYKDYEGREQFWKFDNKNNLIYQNICGDEQWWDYDDENREIHYRNSEGLEQWNEYTTKIHQIDKGKEAWKVFDKNKKLIYGKYSDGYEEWNEYDEQGNLTHHKDSKGKDEYYNYEKEK